MSVFSTALTHDSCPDIIVIEGNGPLIALRDSIVNSETTYTAPDDPPNVVKWKYIQQYSLDSAANNLMTPCPYSELYEPENFDPRLWQVGQFIADLRMQFFKQGHQQGLIEPITAMRKYAYNYQWFVKFREAGYLYAVTQSLESMPHVVN